MTRALARAVAHVGIVGLLLAGCRGVDGGPPATDPTLLPAGSRAEQDALDRDLSELLEQAQRARRGGGWPSREEIVLAPLAPEEYTWSAVALTWSLARLHGGVRPAGAARRFQSVPDVQAWLRDRDAELAWFIQIHPGPAPSYELVAAWRNGAWRSGERPLPREPASQWPLSAPHAGRVRSSEVPPAEGLRWLEGKVWLEARDGLRELRRRGDAIQVGDLEPWSEWNRSPLERWDDRASFPVVGIWDADLRLELRRSSTTDGDAWQWWLARTGSAMALSSEHHTKRKALALIATPRGWSSQRSWLLLREDEQRFTVDWIDAELRILPRAPVRLAPGSPPVRFALPDPSPTPWPVDRASLWWHRHLGVALFSFDIREDRVVSEPEVEARARDDARCWELRLPELAERGQAPAIESEDWARALENRLTDPRAPGWYDWLLDPMRGATITAKSWGVELRWDSPVPDLRERLAHPVLALTDPTLAARFASHRVGDDASLVARHGSQVPVLPRDLDASGQRRAIREGGIHMLRPYELSYDPTAWSPALEGGVERREDDRVVALICSDAAPDPLRRRLARLLGSVTPQTLLATDDPRLAPVWPATGRSQVVSRDGSASDGPEFRLVIQIDAAFRPRDEAQRAVDRLRLLLASHGVSVSSGASQAGADPVVYARLIQLSLMTGDPLLRALELQSWTGGHQLSFEQRQSTRLPLDEPRRLEAARILEARLVEEGRVVPLWTQPGTVWVDPELGAWGPAVRGLPGLLHEIRWETDAKGRGSS